MKTKLVFFLLVGLVTVSCSSWNYKENISCQGSMEYVPVCSSLEKCMYFSRLVMGTDHLIQGDWNQAGQKQMSQQEVYALLDEAVKLGINIFDTSPIYVGNVENVLGKWIKDRNVKVQDAKSYQNSCLNPDRRIYALSKGGFPFDLFYSKEIKKGDYAERFKVELQKKGVVINRGHLQNVPAGTYASRLYGDKDQIKQRVLGELEHSHKNLNGNIAVYLMHRDDGDYIEFKKVLRDQTPVVMIMEALKEVQERLPFSVLGWSNWETERVEESLKLSNKRADLPRPVLDSPYFSLFEMTGRTIHAGGVQVTHEEMMNPSFLKGIKIMPYSPLGGFSILDKPEPRWESAKKAAKKKYDAGDPYWQNVFHAIFTEKNRQRYERVLEFTKRFNKEHKTDYSIDQMINAYALAHPRTDFLAVGPITPDQLHRTVGSLSLAKILTPEDLDYLYYGF